MKIVFSKECLEYRFGNHPESPERVKNTYEFLRKKGFRFLEPKPCTENDLLVAHSREMINHIKKEDFLDFETPSLPGIYHYARLSVGGALLAMKVALEGTNSFSLMRPPGHHASQDNYEGFCYFNNIAIAALKARRKARNVAILDIDVHHGNGSESLLMGKKGILYVSLHQYGFIYPGTGRYSNDNVRNFPMDAGTSGKIYLQNLSEALNIIREFNPGLIGVSAGFDTFEGDPLAGIKLEVGTYEKIGKMIRDLRKPVFSVLEGGYSEKMPECVYSYIKGLQ
ncbi:MAG: histone deacetylase [Candidatus Aenigmarchaeota archaeon]|nr:histone deacetylase [Candidatus Aenigmarchaeota archaeon]